MKKKIIFLGLISFSLLSFSATTTNLYEKSNEKFSFELNTGVLNGESLEKVLWGDHLASELIWRLESVPIIGMQFGYQINQKFSININGWSKVGESTSTMDDYDWLEKSNSKHTHWSSSSTELEKAYNLDINIDYSIYETEKMDFKTMIGFKNSSQKWVASGGSGVYFGIPVSFPDGPVITYEENFYVPYLGFAYDYTINKWSYNTFITGTTIAWANNYDNHHLRDLTFEENIHNISYLNFGGDISYSIRENLAVNLAISYQKYFHAVGDTTQTNDKTGEVKTFDSSSGMEHYSYITSIGLIYSF